MIASRRTLGVRWSWIASLLLVTLAAASCGGSSPTALDQPYNEHEWVEVGRIVSGVRGVVLAMPGHLRIEQGPGETLTMRGEMILLPSVITQVRDGILQISLDEEYPAHPGRPTEFLLSAPSLESAELTAHGAIECSGFEGERLTLRASQAGDLDFQDLSADQLQVTSTLGAGGVRASGAVSRQIVEVAGVADYEAPDLDSAEARVTISGPGSATVRVRDRLTAIITGSGSVYYYGNPQVESSVTGSGEIVKLGN